MIDKPDYIDTDGVEYRITEFLWTCPSMPTWQRLALFWFYVPYLIGHFISGTPIWIAKKTRSPHANPNHIRQAQCVPDLSPGPAGGVYAKD